MMQTVIVVLVLAAGGGRRFLGPTHKLDAVVNGRTVLRHAVDSAAASAVGPVIVVSADHVKTALPAGVTRIVNDDWRDGQMSSLRVGLAAAGERNARSVVIGLGDQPFVRPDAWASVAAAASAIAVATYDGQRGHPVKLDHRTWELLPAAGDEGARTLMRLRPDLVSEVPCQGSPTDVDTLEDLRRWQNNSSTSSP